MKFFLFIFIVLLAFVTIGMLVAFYYVRKGIRYFRRFSTGDMSEEEFKRMSDKYYRKQENEGEQFEKDSFKGSGWRRREAGPQGQQRRHTATRTADGVTIVDSRDPEKANKKIFGRDEGEYVEFTEN